VPAYFVLHCHTVSTATSLRTVTLSHCYTVTLSHCHTVSAATSMRTVTLSHCFHSNEHAHCHTATLLHCHTVTLSHCHTVTLFPQQRACAQSHCHTVSTATSMRTVTLPHCHTVTLFPQQRACALSHCHTVTLSHCHTVSTATSMRIPFTGPTPHMKTFITSTGMLGSTLSSVYTLYYFLVCLFVCEAKFMSVLYPLLSN